MGFFSKLFGGKADDKPAAQPEQQQPSAPAQPEAQQPAQAETCPHGKPKGQCEICNAQHAA